MPQGDKSKYTEKRKRQARHIEESYEAQGVSEKKLPPVPGQPSISRIVAERKAVQE